MSFYEKLKFDANGLIPAIIQEQKTGRVVMMAWMNRASLESTVATGKTHFWSRSRQKYWMKGEESGNTQTVKDIAFDCDGDTLLIQVEQNGPACHEGYNSCFFRSIDGKGETFNQSRPAQGCMNCHNRARLGADFLYSVLMHAYPAKIVVPAGK